MNGSHSPTVVAGGRRVGTEAHTPLVSVRGVNKTFRRESRRVRALSDVDLDVAENEIVCLLGPSGCGKSTLLNILAGILPFDEGEVNVNGQAVRGPGVDRGMLFQSPMLFPWLTTRDNVLFGPRAQGGKRAAKKELRQQADAILATVGLVGFEDAYPHELSGGMRHRAAFARALINRPAVLLMDEPFGALDSLTRSRMHEFLLQLWEVHHMTIVFVTHDIEEAILLGDRVCVMGGSPAHIVEQIDVPLGRPRVAEIVETQEFIATKRRVREALLS
jgi:ABC-type nitrate/sulfonate/bicarbonate transport system ATPase subunit